MTVQGEVKGVESGMQLLLGQVEVKGLRHLPLGVAARARVGHCQGQGDTVWGNEEIAVGALYGLVKIESKGGVAANEGSDS